MEKAGEGARGKTAELYEIRYQGWERDTQAGLIERGELAEKLRNLAHAAAS